jgi:hypothetical protein
MKYSEFFRYEYKDISAKNQAGIRVWSNVSLIGGKNA